MREAAGRAGRQVAILQDLPGPKLRIGALADGIVDLKTGDTLTIVAGSDEDGDAERMSVHWPGLADAVDPDDVMYLADGAIRLRVEAVRKGDGEIETVGRGRYSLWTGDPGTALYLVLCLEATATVPSFDDNDFAG